MMNWKKMYKEVFMVHSRYSPVICVLGLRNNVENPRIVGVQPSSEVGCVTNIKHEVINMALS